ncbi:MAG: type II toxin-antitoxin system VapC family toxin [bacterium]
MNVVDTSGWIEFLFEGSAADIFAPLIEDVDNLLVPVVCLYEVFKKVNAVADEPKALQAIGQMKQGRVMAVTEAIALRASLISLKHRLPMADSLILSTAWSEQATLWTQDEHFAGLPGIEYHAVRARASSVRGRPRREGRSGTRR